MNVGCNFFHLTQKCSSIPMQLCLNSRIHRILALQNSFFHQSYSLSLYDQGNNDHANEDVTELKTMLQKEISLRKRAEEEIHSLRNSQFCPTEV